MIFRRNGLQVRLFLFPNLSHTMPKIKLPHILLIAYLILFLVTVFTPYDRAVWRAESLPIMVVVLILVIWYRKFKFSNTAYVLMSLWIFMHTIGAYYTFERVPFDWFNNLFGFERNMYDRVAHYIIGFYAYPLAEYVTRKKSGKSTMNYLCTSNMRNLYTCKCVWNRRMDICCKSRRRAGNSISRVTRRYLGCTKRYVSRWIRRYYRNDYILDPEKICKIINASKRGTFDCLQK